LRTGGCRQTAIPQRVDEGAHPGRHLRAGGKHRPYADFQRFHVAQNDALQISARDLFVHVIDAKLPPEFLASAAYGDLLMAALALTSIFALRSRWSFALPLVWATNTWGFVDLLNGVRGVLQLNAPTFNLATAWYIYTFYAPLVVVSHLMIFQVLLRPRLWTK
jgi:hypothetical protein